MSLGCRRRALRRRIPDAGSPGAGAFRVLVTDAYHRRCAITGEKTLPVLEAAHILFDRGYLTVTPEHRIEVSSRIQQEFTNGTLHYSYHGAELRSLPEGDTRRPAAEHLRWHNEQVFVP